mmetsp:Transcript_21824/g.40154  ORF Transcript_21824/g.40154 Transcript_21824/m.40154 type:complete len:233 (-) Transcript_21824:37-735(-)
MAFESWYDFDEDELSVDEYPFYKHTRSLRRSGKELASGRHPRSPSEAMFGSVATPSEARLARWCVRWPHLWDCYSHEPQDNGEPHPHRVLRQALSTPVTGQVASMSGSSEAFRARTTSSSMYSASSSTKEEKVRPIRLINHLSFKENEEHFRQTVADARRSRSQTMSRSQNGFNRSLQNWHPTGAPKQHSLQVSQKLPELKVGLVRLGHKNRHSSFNESQFSITLSTPEEHD